METKVKKRSSILLKIIAAICFIIVLTAVLVWRYFPFNTTIENQVKSTLEAAGFTVNSLMVDQVSDSALKISNINIENKIKIKAERVELDYALPQLAVSRFRSGAHIDVAAKNIYLKSKPYEIEADTLDIKTTGNKGVWSGKASTQLIISGLPQEVPPLNITSDFAIDGNINANIFIKDPMEKYLAEINIKMPETSPTSGVVHIKSAMLPWGGGVVSMNDIKIPLKFDVPVNLVINLDKVQLADLLGKLSDGQISGQGVISGKLPVTYYPDGHITLQQSDITSSEAGIINVSPELIQGDNTQIEFARATLQNFHYTQLKISLSSDQEEKSVINLSLEGRNPEMAEERPVKLNVNLAGDIIPLLQQSLLPLTDFRKYLKETE